MAETPSGMLNSIGLQGPGIDGLLADDLPWLAERDVRAFVSIAGTRVEDFAELAAAAARGAGRARRRGQHQLPERRGPRRGLRLRPVAASDVVAAVRRRDPAQPVFAKLSPDVTDIVSVARACATPAPTGCR